MSTSRIKSSERAREISCIAGSGLRFEAAGVRQFKGIADDWPVFRAV
jgi:hypothetical protein